MRVRIVLGLAVALVFLSQSGCGGSSTEQNRNRSRDLEAVFIGSSQLSHWSLSESFPDRNFIRKAVSGDTSVEMLARFKTDVLDLKPQVAVIWAGENDIDKGVSLSTTQANIIAMRQQAVGAGIRVVLCTVPPKSGGSASQNPKIVAFNDWLRSLGATNAIPIADFYAVLVNTDGQLKPEFADGDEHLTQAAYTVVTPIVAAAIATAEQ
jgi:lysophospholipase L1-like esterase